LQLSRFQNGNGFIAQLMPEALALLESRARQVRVHKGHIIVDHGSSAGDVYCVTEGAFDVIIMSPVGREVYLRQIQTGALFGEYAALDGGPRSATVVAASDASVMAMKNDDFLQSLKLSPAAAVWVARNLAYQIRDLTERLFELSALSVASRLHCELMRLCILAGVDQNRSVIDPSPTHADLANRIGTHREAVTREMNELTHMNILTQKGRHLEIDDVARLSRMVATTGGDLSATALQAGSANNKHTKEPG
jgi:CRP/FNR family cyclic AMP-dependent transcriptional regulator